MGAKLNEKQKRFAREYLIDLNATQAAIRAGYSKKTAAAQASRLLTNVNLQNLIAAGANKLQERTEITAERVLQEYAKIAFLDPRKLFNDDDSLKHINELDDDTSAAIAGLDIQDTYEGFGDEREFVGNLKKIKLADKKGALDSIARHLGMFNDKLTLAGTLEHKIKDLTDDELSARIVELAAETGAIAAVRGTKAQEE